MKTILVLAFATLAAAAGETFISKGMKQVGDVSVHGLVQSWKGLAAAANSWVLLGVACTTVFFLLYAASLSWSDLSYAQPITALTYVFGTLAAKYVLKEEVSGWRWWGVFVIVVGIVLVTRDPRETTVR